MPGAAFDITDDSAIFAIDSPQAYVFGPHKVIYRNIEERWVIVALDWKNKPRLGIRWFHDAKGSPLVRGYASWFVIPPTLVLSMLNGLPLDIQSRKNIEKYLTGEIDGLDLQLL